MNKINHVNNKGQSVLMQICKMSDNDDKYDIIKQLLDEGSDIDLIDNDGNKALNYLIFDGHNNRKTIALFLSFIKENNKPKIEKIEIIDWKQKYLNFFVENEITLPPLTEDSYDYEIEYKRVVEYKDWKTFTESSININTTELYLIDCSLKEIPKEIGNLINFVSNQ